MKLHHGGPVEYIGSRYKRSVPPNITRVRKKNATRDTALAHGKSSVRYGQQKVYIKRVTSIRLLELNLNCLKCNTLREATKMAKLFLETTVIRYRNGWYVRCV